MTPIGTASLEGLRDTRRIMPLPSHPPPPHAADAAERAYAWADRQGLTSHPGVLHKLRRSNPDDYVTCCHPESTPQRLADLCKSALWGWVIDDALEDPYYRAHPGRTAAALARLSAALHGTAPCPQPSGIEATRDIFTTLCANRSPHWSRVFRAETDVWFATHLTEAAALTADRTMTPHEYIAHRQRSSNIITCMHKAEYACDVDLPAGVRQWPSLVRMRARGAEWCGLYNDICSVERDHAAAYPHNLVLILVRTDHCTLQQAVDAATDHLARVIQDFQRAADDVAADLKAHRADTALRHDVDQVVHAYRHVVRGNYDFHTRQPRYAGLHVTLTPLPETTGHPAPDPPTGSLLRTPEDEELP